LVAFANITVEPADRVVVVFVSDVDARRSSPRSLTTALERRLAVATRNERDFPAVRGLRTRSLN